MWSKPWFNSFRWHMKNLKPWKLSGYNLKNNDDVSIRNLETEIGQLSK